MSAIEQGLQELGLLDMTMQGCLRTGLSIKDFLAKAITAVQPALDSSTITDEERNKLANAVFEDTMERAGREPEYMRTCLKRTTEQTPGFEMTPEEARLLCQD